MFKQEHDTNQLETRVHCWLEPVAVCAAAVTRTADQGPAETFVPTALESGGPRSECRWLWFLPGPHSLGCWWPSLHAHTPCVLCVSKSPPLCKDTGQIGSGPSLKTSF